MSGNLLMKTRVVAVRDVARDVRSIEIVHHSRPSLPAFTAGAHILVETPAGPVRQYSLCSDPEDARSYRIGILKEPRSRGGSRSMHDAVSVGDALYVTRPRNNFPLCEDAERHLLIAGGIGITPILAMAYALHREGASFDLHYCARDADRVAFADELRSLCPPGRLHFHVGAGDPARRLDVRKLLEAHPANTHLYVCGPQGLLDAATIAAGRWPGEAIHFEQFTAVAANQRAHGEPFDIEVAPEGKIVAVGPDETALDALLRSGARIPYQCEGGICGTCRVRVLSGQIIHRDAVLKPAERADTMITCVSRGKGRIGIALIEDDD